MLKNNNYPVYGWNVVDQLYVNDVYDTNVELHSHTFWEISITKKGKYINHFKTGDILFSPYTLAIIRPKDVHYINIAGTDAEYCDFYIKDEDMKRFCDFYNENLYDELKNNYSPIICKIDKPHFDSIELTASSISMQKMYLTQNELEFMNKTMIIKCLGAFLESKIEIKDTIPKWLLGLLDNINNLNFKQYQSTESYIDMLVSKSSYSHGHVCREFKKYFNTTLINYVNKKKLQYSTSLLIDKTINISEIAQIIGYSNQSNFVNAFKKEFNESPTSWRKKNCK